MTPDDATLMAYADGELDPLAAKRVEQALAADPALARTVEAHRALRARMAVAYPAAPTPAGDPLAARIAAPATVVPFTPRVVPRTTRPRWRQVAAMAACLVVGVAVGTQWQSGPVTAKHGALIAAGPLARALDTRLAATTGETRMLLSFRGRDGRPCRVFAAPAVDGIACHDADGWSLVRTRSAAAAAGGDYRQAGSADAALMAEAQEMIAGEPLSREQEAAAVVQGWR